MLSYIERPNNYHEESFKCALKFAVDEHMNCISLLFESVSIAKNYSVLKKSLNDAKHSIVSTWLELSVDFLKVGICVAYELMQIQDSTTLFSAPFLWRRQK